MGSKENAMSDNAKDSYIHIFIAVEFERFDQIGCWGGITKTQITFRLSVQTVHFIALYHIQLTPYLAVFFILHPSRFPVVPGCSH